MLATRYGAIESDFLRFYRLDIAGVYDGTLSPRKAGRLLYELPPEAAVRRGEDIDQRLLSGEEAWLRVLVNMQLEPKDRAKFPSELWEQQQREDRNRARAEARLSRRRSESG